MSEQPKLSAGRITAKRAKTQEQRDLQRYGDRWYAPMTRTSAHSMRSRQMAAQGLDR